MKLRTRTVLAVLLFLAAVWAVAWLEIRPRDPLFHGKPESYWIAHLTYRDDDQVKQWREFGPEGVQVLARALEGANRPADRIYRRVYRRMIGILPGALTRLLPAPHMDLTRSTRMVVAEVLSRLGNDAKLATPVMANSLNDEDAGVRQIAINFFTAGEDANAPLNHLDAQTKRNLLPAFIQNLQDNSNWGLRNNAAVALRYYPEQRETVIPPLENALKDPAPQVRLMAARALNQVAPDANATAKSVPVVIEILTNSNGQLAYWAAEFLGEMQQAPSLEVPALIEAAEGSNQLVACAALHSLGEFPKQTEPIVPALLEALKSPDGSIRHSAANALKRIDPAAARKAGVN